MAVFDDIPDEILAEIFSHIHMWRDLTCVSFVSRRLQRVAAPALAESNTYRFINCGTDEEDGSEYFRSLLYSTLRSILIRPELALYVHKVDLQWNYCEDNEYLGLAELEGSKPQLLELALDHTGLLEWEHGKALVDALKEDKQDAYIALFLMMLSNLQSLSITVSREDDIWVPWAIRKIVSSDFVPSPLSSGFLSLREVGVSYNSDYSVEEGVSLDSISPYFLLPSLDSIDGDIVVHDEEFNWEGEYGSSSVTSLWFEYSAIHKKSLETMLRIPKALQYFYYSHANVSMLPVDFDYDEVVALVAKCQGSLLQSHIDIIEW